MDEKDNLLEILRKPKKILKNGKCIIYHIFQEKFNKPRVNFLPFGPKKASQKMFEKTFKNFENFFSENCEKGIV